MPTFFNLPSELRNAIYEDLVISAAIIKCTSFDPVPPPAVTRVCRQMRQEAISMYYSENSFRLRQAVYTCEAARRISVLDMYLCTYERPSSRNSPIGVLGHWIQSIGLAQFKFVQVVLIPIKDAYSEYDDPHQSNHGALVYIAFGKGDRKFSEAAIRVDVGDGMKRFRRIEEENEGGRGRFGKEYESHFRTKPWLRGCAPFNHFLFRYLSSLEPEINGRQEVPLSAEGNGDKDGNELQEDSGAHPEEICPPTRFYPTADLFSVLTILDDAMQYHCCCCMREPATARPTRPTAKSKLSYDDDEFMGYTEDSWPWYCDDVNWEVLEAKQGKKKEEEENEDENENENEQWDEDEEADPRARRLYTHQPRLLEAMMWEGYDYEERFDEAKMVESKSRFKFYELWKERRERAGYWVPTLRQLGGRYD
ncbi:hypothetical protein BU26DRAFT_500836 [Trematosphaeria pertusa]|uniref:F-box domain-containing protein n=1 Tax=Trematosphaeria pertusa TaxID=390896 RepID=A0A6A6IYV6_9PLEO|nr:uncharacterized protein BU26DRAFT_500836 [Trematosphaeria pertusa]KAF2255237.1 hypothetical protein BU26DRAFT_500836 [Trematosphaeria pertusa]